MNIKQTTICLLLRENQILLAMKKRGFGTGKWNGTGGELQPGETSVQSAIRETQEEIGITMSNPILVGDFHFKFPKNPEWEQQTSVYICRKWKEEPQETEEMKPQWFDFNKIPYDQMWPADIFWIPLVLAGKKLTAEFLFDVDKLIRYNLKIKVEVDKNCLGPDTSRTVEKK